MESWIKNQSWMHSHSFNQQIISQDYLSKSFVARGFTFQHSKNKELEIGFSIQSFTIQKENIVQNCFVMKLQKNSFICAGYRNGKLIQEKQVKFETDIPDTFVKIFETNKKKAEQNPFRFDLQLENLRKVCEKTERTTKNYQNFSQQIKTTPEYIKVANLQKFAYEALLNDAQKIKKDRTQIQVKNKQLIDALLQIESKKQLLQTSIHSFNSQNQYLSNTTQRIDEQIDLIKSNSIELNASNINQVTFKKYLDDLIYIKELQIKKKCLRN